MYISHVVARSVLIPGYPGGVSGMHIAYPQPSPDCGWLIYHGLIFLTVSSFLRDMYWHLEGRHIHSLFYPVPRTMCASLFERLSR